MEADPEPVASPVRDGGAAFVVADPSVLAGTSPVVDEPEPDPETITGAGMVPPHPGPDEDD